MISRRRAKEATRSQAQQDLRPFFLPPDSLYQEELDGAYSDTEPPYATPRGGPVPRSMQLADTVSGYSPLRGLSDEQRKAGKEVGQMLGLPTPPGGDLAAIYALLQSMQTKEDIQALR